MADAFLAWLYSHVLAPASTSDISVFYFIWMGIYFVIHVVWDICTPHTEPFHWSKLKEKQGQIFSASAFASNLLLIFSTINPDAVLRDYTIPICISGFSGLIYGIGNICPHTKQNQNPPQV